MMNTGTRTVLSHGRTTNCIRNSLRSTLLFRSRRSRSAAAYSDQTFPVDDLSVCTVHCEKTADRIRMPFDMSDGSRDEAGSGVWDRSVGRGTFEGEFGARHCNQWGFYGVRVRQCCDAALFPGQTCSLIHLI